MDNTCEVWKDVLGYEGLYLVSNHGRVQSLRFNIEMKQKVSKGYYIIGLTKDGKQKTHSVHRLVAESFINNPEDKPEVNHIDENKLNNHSNNLSWVTSKENSNWGSRNRKISEYQKIRHRPKGQKRVLTSMKNLGNKLDKRCKAVEQVDKNTGEVIYVYSSVSEASSLNNFHQGNISSCLSGKREYANGYKWRYMGG